MLKETVSSPAEVRAVVKEAYIYGFPLVDNYRIQYSYFVDRSDPEFKAPWNTIKNESRVFTPEDKTVQTPNSDTPYSVLGADLRTEPLVLTMPAVESSRYFSAQFIDLYTHNFAYAGSRTTGNKGGTFLLAGPNWKGTLPTGIDSAIQSETDLTLVVYRTQLFRPDDIENVKKVQAGYTVQPLSEFLGDSAPKPAPPISFLRPIRADEERTSLEFFKILNFVLQFCPIHPSERDLMERFEKIDIGAGKSFNVKTLPLEIYKAFHDGIADAWETFNEFKTRKVDTGKVASGDLFGTREHLRNNYLYRMAAAVLGIYGNSQQEAMYPIYWADAAGQKLNGSNRYKLRFAPGQLPPVNAFWSITMYVLPTSLLYANPLNRYLINSPMLPDLKRDADGGLTIYIQHDSPGKDNEPNWLPAPKGPFAAALRLYWPKHEAMTGQWKQPALERQN
jgi:hypothetical protein